MYTLSKYIIATGRLVHTTMKDLRNPEEVQDLMMLWQFLKMPADYLMSSFSGNNFLFIIFANSMQ
jgi:hypothetical protein